MVCVWHGNHCHFNTTFATHTTVTVIGGAAKQLLGSSTDWCATTIVTPHTRGPTSTHTHGWQSGVMRSMCCDCCVHQHLHGHFTLPHHLCVCHLISQVCVTIHSITPLLFSHIHPFFGVCVALSSGIHALFVVVDALVLASVPLIWGTPCLPSTTACVCGDGVPALPWPCQPLAIFLACFLVCSSSHCFNLH